MANIHEDKSVQLPHKLVLDERRQLTMNGVKDVESFDEQLVVLRTARGTLVVRGSGLHLQQLSPEGGQVHVDGTVDSLTYEDTGTDGFFSRLFG